MTPLSPQDLESIKTRLGKATAGEWKVGRDIFSKSTVLFESGPIADCFSKKDADFIAHSKQDIESLLTEVGRLQTMNYALSQGKVLELQQENSRLKESLALHFSQGPCGHAHAVKLVDGSCLWCTLENVEAESQRYRTALESLERQVQGWINLEYDDFLRNQMKESLLPREGK